MKFKKALLPLLCSSALLAQYASAVPLNDPRSAARGGTGVAIGDIRSTTINPATLMTAPKAYFMMNISAGAFASAPKDILDDIEDLQDDIDEFEQLINSADPGNIPAAEGVKTEIIDGFHKLDNKSIYAEVGGTPLIVAIAPEKFKGALFTKMSSVISATIDYDLADDNVLENAIITGDFDANNLGTSIYTRAAALAEIGFTYANSFDSGIGNLDWGTAAKYQRLMLVDRLMTINEFDEGDTFENDRDLKEKSFFNVDFGIVQHLGGSNWRLGAAVENLIPHTEKFNGQKYEFKPQVTAGVAYDLNWFKFETNMDLLANERFGILDKTQMLRIGAEIGWRHLAQLRIGYVHDLKGNEQDLYTAGIGISPFDVLNIDIAAMVGKDTGKKKAGAKQDVGGVMVGIGLKF